MFVASYRNTMAGARRLVKEQPEVRYVPPKLVEAPKQSPAVVIQITPADRLIQTPMDELRRVIDLVSRMHGATYREVVSKSRRHGAVNARVAAMGAIKNLRPCMSMPQMGRIFNRDHTTILWALNKWEGTAR